MSLTKSFNKHTNTYYAYDTTYVWDEKLQKKVQKRKCIGRFDPKTNEVIANGRRGRPPRVFNVEKLKAAEMKEAQDTVLKALPALLVQLEKTEQMVELLGKEIQAIRTRISELTTTHD